jgi:mono/diheme cytochrome c family protein
MPLRHTFLASVFAGALFAGLTLAPAVNAAEDTRTTFLVAEGEATPASAPVAAPADMPTFTPEQIEAGFRAFRGSDCAGCHGWAGNGDKIGENPKGPSLRSLGYDAASLIEVILCGRPGTVMPSHKNNAYKDDSCYGMNEAAIGKDIPPKGKPMTLTQATDIANYIQSELYGRPDKASLEECQKYYGKKPLCSSFKPAAELGVALPTPAPAQ